MPLLLVECLNHLQLAQLFLVLVDFALVLVFQHLILLLYLLVLLLELAVDTFYTLQLDAESFQII